MLVIETDHRHTERFGGPRQGGLEVAEDGVPVFAIAEERINRVKYYGGFPKDAIPRYRDAVADDASGEALVAAIEAVRSGAIRPPMAIESGPSVPEALRPFVSRMLAPEPRDRPTATEVARALEQFQLHSAQQMYP